MTLNIIDSSSCAKHSIRFLSNWKLHALRGSLIANPLPVERFRSGQMGGGEAGFFLKDRWGGFLVTTREPWDFCRCRGSPDICIS